MCTVWGKDGKKIHIWKIIHSETFFFKELHLGSTSFKNSFKICILLFLTLLGLYCCVLAFFSCGAWVPLWLWCAGFSMQWLLLLQRVGSVVGRVDVHRFSCSAARDQTGVPCIAKQSVNHWTTREAPFLIFFIKVT